MKLKPSTSCQVSIASASGLSVVAALAVKIRPGSKLKSWSVQWGDGSSSTGASALPPTAEHVYSAPGSYTVTLKVNDSAGMAAENRTALTVQAPAPQPEPVPQPEPEPTPQPEPTPLPEPIPQPEPIPPASGGGVFGVLQLDSTFDCISMRCPFPTDTDRNAVALLEFRPAGTGTWFPAYTPHYDVRTTIQGGSVPNPLPNQFRGSIVGLPAGQSFDVRLTITDPGVPQVVYEDRVSTLAPDVPLGGRTWSVTPQTIGEALAGVNGGDTISLGPGTYPAFTIARSGTAGAWIAIVGQSRDACIISGSGATNAITVDADYVQFKNLRTTKSNANGVELAPGRHHAWFDNVYIEDIAGTAYDNACFLVRSNTHHLYILNSFLRCPSITRYGTGGGPRSEDFGAGVYFKGGMSAEGTFVFKGNDVNGKFRDGIGNEGEVIGTGSRHNTDIANNRWVGIGDDCIQMEDDAVNLRIWGNDIDVYGQSAFATQQTWVGPVYIFRNRGKVYHAEVFNCVWKSVYGARTYVFHNSFRATVPGADMLAAGGTDAVVLNNIIASEGAANPVYGGQGRYDYNLYHRTTNPILISSWGGVNYEQVGAGSPFAAATGNEAHGRSGDPKWADVASLVVAAGSPAIDGGVIIPNFNDAHSAWPFKGQAPDMGAHEVM